MAHQSIVPHCAHTYLHTHMLFCLMSFFPWRWAEARENSHKKNLHTANHPSSGLNLELYSKAAMLLIGPLKRPFPDHCIGNMICHSLHCLEDRQTLLSAPMALYSSRGNLKFSNSAHKLSNFFSSLVSSLLPEPSVSYQKWNKGTGV